MLIALRRDWTYSGAVPLIEGRLGHDQGWQKNFQAHGGVASDGSTYYYLLGQDLDNGSDWYIYQINNSTYALTGSFRIGGSGAFGGFEPRIFFDTTNNRLGMVWQPSSTNLMLRWFNPTISSGQIGSDRVLLSNPGNRSGIGAAWYGADGTGTNRLYVALRNTSGFSNVMSWTVPASSTTDPTRAPTFDFPRAGNSVISGLCWDATTNKMQSLARTGKLFGYSNTFNSLTLAAKHAWYDGDALGASPPASSPFYHETGAPAAASVTWPARGFVQVATPEAPEYTNTEPSNHDKANQVKLYMSVDGGATWKYRIFTGPPWSTGTMGDLSAASPGTPGSGSPFPTALTPSLLRSTGVRLDGTPKTYLSGDGSARIDGLIAPGTIAMFAGTVLPFGWLNCDGSLVPSSTYPDLYGAMGSGKFFGSSGSDFYLPDFRGRMPMGYWSSDPDGVVAALGAYETSTSGGHPSTGAAGARLAHQHTHGSSGAHHHSIAGQSPGTPRVAGTSTGSVASQSDYSGHAHGGGTNNNSDDANHTHDSAGVGGNLQYHGFMTVSFIIKT
jgi:microcystin-dependent protein